LTLNMLNKSIGKLRTNLKLMVHILTLAFDTL
jgi:hypothetical protein